MHPTDAFMGAPSAAGGGGYVPGASGRLVFGCVLEKSALLNDYDTCGRAESKKGFGEAGFHMAKFAARIGVYGSRVLAANNVLTKTEEGNFLYRQTTVETIAQKGNRFKIGTNRTSTVMWDYSRVMGLDINKEMYGLVRASLLESRKGGYFEEGVVVKDNWDSTTGTRATTCRANGARSATTATSECSSWKAHRSWAWPRDGA